MSELTMTDLTKSIEKEYNELSERFTKHYEEVIKPSLPKELTNLVETQSAAIKAKVDEQNKDKVIDYDSVETYEAMKKGLEMLRAVAALYGIK